MSENEIKAKELTDAELEQASGGFVLQCPICMQNAHDVVIAQYGMCLDCYSAKYEPVPEN